MGHVEKVRVLVMEFNEFNVSHVFNLVSIFFNRSSKISSSTAEIGESLDKWIPWDPLGALRWCALPQRLEAAPGKSDATTATKS